MVILFLILVCKMQLLSAQPTIRLNDWIAANKKEIYASCGKRIQTSLDFIFLAIKRQQYENTQLREEIEGVKNQTSQQTDFIEQWMTNITHLVTTLREPLIQVEKWTSTQTIMLHEMAENVTYLMDTLDQSKQTSLTSTADDNDDILNAVTYDEYMTETPAVPTTEEPTLTSLTEPNYKDVDYPEDCTAIYDNVTVSNGLFMIKPNGSEVPFNVRCETHEGRAWAVIQTRLDGSVDFYRNWKDYKNGFGNLSGEFWLGNEKIYQITDQAKYKLRIDMWDWEQTTEYPDGNHYYTESSSFRLDNETNFYSLSVPDDYYAYSGYGGSGLRVHSGPFITHDVQPDIIRGNCAEKFHCGWWFSTCVRNANLNGKYYIDGYSSVSDRQRAIDDIYWPNIAQSLRKVVMKISRQE